MRTAIEVADIFRAEGPGYRAVQAGHLSLTQLKVMSAIENCRTAALGGHVDACEDCGHWRIAYNSCRNRHDRGAGSSTRSDGYLAFAAPFLSAGAKDAGGSAMGLRAAWTVKSLAIVTP